MATNHVILSLILLLTSRIVVTGEESNSTTADVHQSNSTTVLSTPTCTGPGLQCSSYCEELITCVSTNETNDFYLPITISTCNPSLGQYCNLTSRDCSAQYCSSELYRKEKFICNQEGIFPDPFDCHVYHICTSGTIGVGSVIGLCTGNQSFNIEFLNCTSGTASRSCKESLVEECKINGQIGVVQENKRFFYTCKITPNGFLIPQIYKCPEHHEFNVEDYACKVPTGTATSLSISFIVMPLTICAHFLNSL